MTGTSPPSSALPVDHWDTRNPNTSYSEVTPQKPAQRLLGEPLDFDPYVGLIEPVLGVNMLAMCAACSRC